MQAANTHTSWICGFNEDVLQCLAAAVIETSTDLNALASLASTCTILWAGSGSDDSYTLQKELAMQKQTRVILLERMLKEHIEFTDIRSLLRSSPDLSAKGLQKSDAKLLVDLYIHDLRNEPAQKEFSVKVDSWIYIPIDQLTSITKVESIDLSSGNLGWLSCIFIEGCMASKRHLNDNGASALSIDLRWNGFGTQGARAIAPALQYNSMTECMLRGNGIGVDGWATIFKTLSDNPASRVSTWDLSGEHLGPNIAEPLARYISVTTSLTKLSLAKNELGEAGTKIICESMKGNNTLKEIDLSGDSYFGSNIDRAAGAEHVADLLRVTDSLTECNLRNNLLKEESAKKLAKIGTEKRITLFGIRHGQTEADFRGDRLDFVDAILIGNDLVVTTSLTSVNLNENMIGGYFQAGNFISTPAGPAAIASAIMHTQSLTVITLSHNNLRGAHTFPSAIRDGKSIVAVDLLYNGINTVSANLLADVAMQKKISLCGIMPEQTEADFKPVSSDFGPWISYGDALLIKADLATRPSLTRIDIREACFDLESNRAICKAAEQFPELELLGGTGYQS